MKRILFSIITVISISTYAQNVGVGTAAPAAKLDVTSTNSGILIPRVGLTGSNDATTVPSPVTSTMIYNTATVSGGNAVTPGYYYWMGTAWLRVIDNSSVPNIYTADGSLTGNRTVTMGADNLTLSSTTGNLIFNPSSTGYVGIGTPSPAYMLDMTGGYFHTVYNTSTYPASTAAGGLAISWNRTGGSAEVNFYNVYNNAGMSYQFSQKTGATTSTDLMTIMGNGNVGIGTTGPNNKLEITAGAGASGLRFTNLSQNTTSSGYSKGKYLALNSSGDVIQSSPISAESRYMVCVRRMNTNGNATWSTVFTATDEYGLPYPASGVITYTAGSPYNPGIKQFVGTSGYLNPYYDAIDQDAFLGAGSNYVLIYDFYIVFPTTGTYTFSLPGTVDDVAAFYTSPLNDLNPSDMVQRTLVSQYSSAASPANYAVTATAGDAVRARVYYAQGGGGASLGLNVSGASSNTMNMVYSIK
jgi:hypothetical protein